MITMEVGPVDWTKFQSALEWMNSQPAPGLRSNKVYRMEGDPSKLLMVQEWDSHDAFHASSEKVGDEFNQRAGTEGLDWRTGVWSA
jgi:heme-degrading monooxygenase HmoA